LKPPHQSARIRRFTASSLPNPRETRTTNKRARRKNATRPSTPSVMQIVRNSGPLPWYRADSRSPSPGASSPWGQKRSYEATPPPSCSTRNHQRPPWAARRGGVVDIGPDSSWNNAIVRDPIKGHPVDALASAVFEIGPAARDPAFMKNSPPGGWSQSREVGAEDEEAEVLSATVIGSSRQGKPSAIVRFEDADRERAPRILTAMMDYLRRAKSLTMQLTSQLRRPTG